MNMQIDLLGEYVTVRNHRAPNSVITPYRGYLRRPRLVPYQSRVEEIHVVRAVINDALRYTALVLSIVILYVTGTALQ